jgi:hypothetical protein
VAAVATCAAVAAVAIGAATTCAAAVRAEAVGFFSVVMG